MYYIYVLLSLTPMLIIFLLKSDLNYWLWALLISIVGFAFSNFYIYVQNKKTNDEHANIESIEIAEPKYIPIYIAYFVISLSINDIILFFIVYVIVFLFVIKGKFSYFNPYLLLCYNFYEAEIKNDKSANYKIFLISKNIIKNVNKQTNLIRLNDFVFLEHYKKERNEN
ncbi:hypothetical protein [Campylobacter lanienae]|uniref:Integral membrane protein n=1 Tax=Campylobacter lanienae TaxID=75658 RepID=A0ABY3G8R2_9BACT|nr:hypothetical protein [Campylobacter lanienae]MCI7363725.1 hypothetical protein [Campylobacter lanienae]MDD5786731.1 hypothetical protein [Campylobacter lanienae]TWO29652.1 hypothetical protein XK09_03225 [Campylobacter lanienae]